MTEHSRPSTGVSKARLAGGATALGVATLAQAIVFVVNGLSNSKDHEKFGFKYGVTEASNLLYTQITPANYTFIIWAFIYTWQILWLGYAWSLVCRKTSPSPLSTGVYIGFTILSILTCAWLYLWGNLITIWAAAVLISINITFYATIAVMVIHFNKVEANVGKVDRILTRILPLNGLLFYNAWTTIASLINITAAIQYEGGPRWLDGTDAATISLTLLLAALLAYFILENTILDRYLRYALSVYPVVIWAVIGVLVGQENTAQQNPRNYTYGIALLVVAAVLTLVRVVLFILFSLFRPLPKPGEAQKKKAPEYTSLSAL